MYVNNIMGLPTTMGENPREVEEFYKCLLYNVQSLETLGKLRDVAGNVRVVLDKLKGIMSDLVWGHEQWQEWDYRQLLQVIGRTLKRAKAGSNQESQPTSQKERIIRMMGFCTGDPIRPNRMLEDRCMGVSTVIRPVTFQQIVQKLSQLETAKRSSAKSNYVLLAPVTDTELKAVEAADVETVNANITHQFVTRQAM